MAKNVYTTHDYIGTFTLGLPCHIYELWRNGKKIYTLRCQLKEDGSSAPEGEKEFYRRVDLFMDADRNSENGKKD